MRQGNNMKKISYGSWVPLPAEIKISSALISFGCSLNIAFGEKMQLIIMMFSESAPGLASADRPKALLPNAGSLGWDM